MMLSVPWLPARYAVTFLNELSGGPIGQTH